jgi:hypothetical protein
MVCSTKQKVERQKVESRQKPKRKAERRKAERREEMTATSKLPSAPVPVNQVSDCETPGASRRERGERRMVRGDK